MTYPGGKGAQFRQIVNRMPPHETYIEAFLGGGAVAKNKRPARDNIAIEIDGAVLAETGRELGRNWWLVEADALSWLADWEGWRGGELVYLDPPYLMETRSCGREIYDHEFCTVEEHEALLRVLLRLPAMVMISGYWSRLYNDMLRGWSVATWQAKTRGGVATEYLWFNFPEPVALHDYGWLGDNFRERERIKRKQARWVGRLGKMDVVERRALLAAIGEAWRV